MRVLNIMERRFSVVERALRVASGLQCSILCDQVIHIFLHLGDLLV